MSKPYRPNFASNKKIIHTLEHGPKSWSELLKLTRLNRTVLSKALDYLEKEKVLRQTRLPKHGRHVQYDLLDPYRLDHPERNRSRLRELALPPGERKAMERVEHYYSVAARKLAKWKRHYGEAERTLDSEWPENRRTLSEVERMFLVESCEKRGYSEEQFREIIRVFRHVTAENLSRRYERPAADKKSLLCESAVSESLNTDALDFMAVE